jgi:hypothetical protein
LRLLKWLRIGSRGRNFLLLRGWFSSNGYLRERIIIFYIITVRVELAHDKFQQCFLGLEVVGVSLPDELSIGIFLIELLIAADSRTSCIRVAIWAVEALPYRFSHTVLQSRPDIGKLLQVAFAHLSGF